MTRDQRRAVLIAPAAGLAGLIALVTLSTLWAYLSWAPLKLAGSLACAGAMLGVVLAAFMEFPRAGPLVRLAALAGLVWLSFLFAQTLGEIASR